MKVAIIGAGNMGGAIARGLAANQAFPTGNIAVSNPSVAKLEQLSAAFPQIYTTTSNTDVITDADLIILAVKPWIMESVIKEIAPAVDFSCQMIMSLAAGITLDDLAGMLHDYNDSPILFRCMPNTAISISQSMTFLSAKGAAEDEINDVSALFDMLGQTDVIDERLLPAVTALCSCGIAFAMRYIRAAVEGAVELGLYPSRAMEYTLQTMLGATALLQSTGNHPEIEIDKVTTPGGVTIKGLNAMEQAGFTTAVIQGLKASV